MHLLKVKILENCPNRSEVIDYYQNIASKKSYHGDSGLDLIFPEDRTFQCNTVTFAGLGIACEMVLLGEDFVEIGESEPFDLVPRSSISKTPLMLANSIGIIDRGYRGEIIAAVRCYLDRNHASTMDRMEYSVMKGDRLFQIVAPDRKPIIVCVVDELSSTERGANGFGSTNQL